MILLSHRAGVGGNVAFAVVLVVIVVVMVVDVLFSLRPTTRHVMKP